MTALDERGTSWRNKTETDEIGDAEEYVAAAGAISRSLTFRGEKPFFIISP